jgi:heme/copper-type cytochrome/quinol oxidase subunit 2
MWQVNRFLLDYSLEDGGRIIAWSTLITSLSIFYVILYLVIASSFFTTIQLYGELYGTVFEGATKMEFIIIMICIIIVLIYGIICSVLLMQAINTVSCYQKFVSNFIFKFKFKICRKVNIVAIIQWHFLFSFQLGLFMDFGI